MKAPIVVCLIASLLFVSCEGGRGWKYLNLMFVVNGKFQNWYDSSWQDEQTFMKAIVNHTADSVNDGTTRVGVMQFTAYPYMRIHMRPEFSWKVMRSIDKIYPHYSDFVRLGKALRYARRAMDRIEARTIPKLLIIISHTQSYDRFHYALKSIKLKGVKIVFIDVGQTYQSLQNSNLVDNYFSVSDYRQINNTLPQMYNIVAQTSDTDECKLQTYNCSAKASCINQQPGYKCLCNKGWRGDGKYCWNARRKPSRMRSDLFSRQNRHPNAQRLATASTSSTSNDTTNLDIMFAIGMSSGMGRKGFNQAKDIIAKAVQNLKSNLGHGIRVGVATFYYIPRINIKVKNWNSKRFQTHLEKLRYRRGVVFMGSAIKDVNTYLNKQIPSSKTRKVLVMITAGSSFDDIQPAVRAAIMSKTKVIFVKIGEFQLHLGKQEPKTNVIIAPRSKSSNPKTANSIFKTILQNNQIIQ